MMTTTTKNPSLRFPFYFFTLVYSRSSSCSFSSLFVSSPSLLSCMHLFFFKKKLAEEEVEHRFDSPAMKEILKKGKIELQSNLEEYVERARMSTANGDSQGALEAMRLAGKCATALFQREEPPFVNVMQRLAATMLDCGDVQGARKLLHRCLKWLGSKCMDCVLIAEVYFGIGNCDMSEQMHEEV